MVRPLILFITRHLVFSRFPRLRSGNVMHRYVYSASPLDFISSFPSCPPFLPISHHDAPSIPLSSISKPISNFHALRYGSIAPHGTHIRPPRPPRRARRRRGARGPLDSDSLCLAFRRVSVVRASLWKSNGILDWFDSTCSTVNG